MRYYWTDERYQITYGKRVARAVKMVDGCSRENGVLCTVARLWLSFLHEESEWKNFESNFAWGVDELHQTYWFEQFFNGKLCCKILYLLSVPIVFFWIGLLGPISSTGGPSSSCEMIILRNNGHGGIIRVCMGIFTTALRNKSSVLLVIWPLTLIKRTHFSELSISRFSTYMRKAQGWTLHFRTPDLRSEKFRRKMIGRPQIQRRI